MNSEREKRIGEGELDSLYSDPDPDLDSDSDPDSKRSGNGETNDENKEKEQIIKDISRSFGDYFNLINSPDVCSDGNIEGAKSELSELLGSFLPPNVVLGINQICQESGNVKVVIDSLSLSKEQTLPYDYEIAVLFAGFPGDNSTHQIYLIPPYSLVKQVASQVKRQVLEIAKTIRGVSIDEQSPDSEDPEYDNFLSTFGFDKKSFDEFRKYLKDIGDLTDGKICFICPKNDLSSRDRSNLKFFTFALRNFSKYGGGPVSPAVIVFEPFYDGNFGPNPKQDYKVTFYPCCFESLKDEEESVSYKCRLQVFKFDNEKYDNLFAVLLAGQRIVPFMDKNNKERYFISESMEVLVAALFCAETSRCFDFAKLLPPGYSIVVSKGHEFIHASPEKPFIQVPREFLRNPDEVLSDLNSLVFHIILAQENEKLLRDEGLDSYLRRPVYKRNGICKQANKKATLLLNEALKFLNSPSL